MCITFTAFLSTVLSISYQCLYICSTFCVQMLLQFYTILYKTSVSASVMVWRDGYALDKILKFCFFFLFYELKLFHDTSNIERQT